MQENTLQETMELCFLSLHRLNQGKIGDHLHGQETNHQDITT